MFNFMAIEAAQRDREREIIEEVRRRRLLAGDATDADLVLAASTARAPRRERGRHPARLATP